MPDPAEAKLTPRRPLKTCLLVLLATARNGGGLRLKPMFIADKGENETFLEPDGHVYNAVMLQPAAVLDFRT
jgi:hypothetical protein